MKQVLLSLVVLLTFNSIAQKSDPSYPLIERVLADPTPKEIVDVLFWLRKRDLTSRDVTVHDTLLLDSSRKLYLLSHTIDGNRHYGAVIIPSTTKESLPVIIFATGGDGMHIQFDLTQDFNHPAVQYPGFLGEPLDKEFIVVIPSFRGQQLIIGEKKYQSEGNVSDAFDGATTDALTLLNVTLDLFPKGDKDRIAIYGGSRGGTVALLAAARDKRISRAIVVAAPTDMKALYQLYPDQFKLLFFNKLLSGETTEQEARRQFIAISPIYFVDQLPGVQLHHDRNDPFVPVSFAEALVGKTKSPEIEYFYYNEGIHGFWENPNFWKHVQTFLKPLIK